MTRTTKITIALAAMLAASAAQAKEPWQIGAGPFLSASDVTSHNKMPLDIRDVTAALQGDKPDWARALTAYGLGGNFPKHSLAIFADDYNGRFKTHLPVSVKYFGDTDFQAETLMAALVGAARFKGLDDAERRSAVEAGLEATALNWARYELGESARKAKAKEPNWSLENGSPKNWNEIFAFWYGPEGQHSVHAALEARDGGPAINAALYQSLADGQAVLLEKKWTPEKAAEVKTHLDNASVLLLTDALKKLSAADEASAPAARGSVAGYWLAAAEVLGENTAAGEAIEAATAKDAGALAIASAIAVATPKGE